MRACPWCGGARILALSSRGLGHGPLKAGTRVRIPLALSRVWVLGRSRTFLACGAFVYRLGRDPFKVQRRVRLPYALLGLWVWVQVEFGSRELGP